MKLSARNILKGTVTAIKKGAIASEIEVDIGGGNIITSTITVTSAENLSLDIGSSVSVIIKSTDVIIGVE